jgi:hypothetical protein
MCLIGADDDEGVVRVQQDGSHKMEDGENNEAIMTRPGVRKYVKFVFCVNCERAQNVLELYNQIFVTPYTIPKV